MVLADLKNQQCHLLQADIAVVIGIERVKYCFCLVEPLRTKNLSKVMFVQRISAFGNEGKPQAPGKRFRSTDRIQCFRDNRVS